MAETPANYEDLIPGDDVEMETEPVVEIERSAAPSAAFAEGEEESNGLPFADGMDEDKSARVTYIDYLKSPVIGLLVGQGDEQALLTAHQMLLETSPWFKDACGKFSDEVSVCGASLGCSVSSAHSEELSLMLESIQRELG